MCGFESQTPWRFIPEASKGRESRPDSGRESPVPGDEDTPPTREDPRLQAVPPRHFKNTFTRCGPGPHTARGPVESETLKM